MIELNQLRQFVAVAECGTLSAAAERLFLSQPALSRSMQKLEGELGVTLFDRAKSRVTLNENGKFFLELCVRLTDELDESVARLRAFDRSRRTVSVGACAPAPLWELLPALSTHYPDKTVSACTKDTQSLVRDLLDGTASIIVTRGTLGRGDVLSFPFGKERLLLNVPETHPLAQFRDGVRFSDMARYSFLLYAQIGDWESLVREKMPDTHFIVQDNWENFYTLAQISALPSFSSDLAVKYFGRTEGSVLIPILDEAAEMTYYCHILRKNGHEFKAFLKRYAM